MLTVLLTATDRDNPLCTVRGLIQAKRILSLAWGRIIGQKGNPTTTVAFHNSLTPENLHHSDNIQTGCLQMIAVTALIFTACHLNLDWDYTSQVFKTSYRNWQQLEWQFNILRRSVHVISWSLHGLLYVLPRTLRMTVAKGRFSDLGIDRRIG